MAVAGAQLPLRQAPWPTPEQPSDQSWQRRSTSGLIATNPVDRVRPPKTRTSTRRALTAAEARAVVAAGADDRFGAAIALLFVQGWRVSEVLGLAWSDLDLDAGVATVSRASVYADGVGMMLGPPKTEGAKGRHLLTPVVVELLRRRRRAQDEERQRAGETWQADHLRGSADRSGLHHDDRRTGLAPGRHQGGCRCGDSGRN